MSPRMVWVEANPSKVMPFSIRSTKVNITTENAVGPCVYEMYEIASVLLTGESVDNGHRVTHAYQCEIG